MAQPTDRTGSVIVNSMANTSNNTADDDIPVIDIDDTDTDSDQSSDESCIDSQCERRVAEEDLYRIDRILAKRVATDGTGLIEYYIQWMDTSGGSSAADDEEGCIWERRDNLLASAEYRRRLDEFEARIDTTPTAAAPVINDRPLSPPPLTSSSTPVVTTPSESTDGQSTSADSGVQEADDKGVDCTSFLELIGLDWVENSGNKRKAEDSQSVAAAAPPPPAKRGRGRPPGPAKSGGKAPAARGRGRAASTATARSVSPRVGSARPVPDFVDGVRRGTNGEIYYFVRWLATSSGEFVLSSAARRQWPDLIIDYLESRLVIRDNS